MKFDSTNFGSGNVIANSPSGRKRNYADEVIRKRPEIGNHRPSIDLETASL